MLFVWLIAIYVITLVSLWIIISRLYGSQSILRRALRMPAILGWRAFSHVNMYRQIGLMKILLSGSKDNAFAELEAVINQWGRLDYAPLQWLTFFGKRGIEKIIKTLEGLQSDYSSCPNTDLNAFTYLLDVIKHKDIGLSKPMSNALYDCIEEIANRAFASNSNFADPKHDLNTMGSSAILLANLRKRLEKMISEVV